jgi:hypothetical protein
MLETSKALSTVKHVRLVIAAGNPAFLVQGRLPAGAGKPEAALLLL